MNYYLTGIRHFLIDPDLEIQPDDLAGDLLRIAGSLRNRVIDNVSSSQCTCTCAFQVACSYAQ